MDRNESQKQHQRSLDPVVWMEGGILILLGCLLIGEMGFLSATRSRLKSAQRQPQENIKRTTSWSMPENQKDFLRTFHSSEPSLSPLPSGARSRPDGLLVPWGGVFNESWSLRRTTLNGVRREMASLKTPLDLDSVADRYLRSWKRKGILISEETGKDQVTLRGADLRKGLSLQMVAKKEGKGQKTQVEVTLMESGKKLKGRFDYPAVIPKPGGARGLLVTESLENGYRMMDVTCGVNRSVTSVKFEMLRKMWEKGWRQYQGVRDPMPGILDYQFYHPGGGDCSLVLIGADSPPKTTIEITARWPETNS